MEGVSWLMIGGAVGVFILFMLAYLVVMLVWPEWVGITGKVAKEAERTHREGESAADDDVTTRWQKKDLPPKK